MNTKIGKILLAGILVLFTGMEVYADDITADVLTYDGKTKMASAEGNVVIHANEGATITGEKGHYNLNDKSIMLTGGVRYEKEAEEMEAYTIYVSSDRTVKGMGSVVFRNGGEGRILKGDTVTYNANSGYGLIEGNGYLEHDGGIILAPRMEGNLKGIHITASGGVEISSPSRNLTGHAVMATYTRSGRNGDDGVFVLSGNAEVVQNGNTFTGPELVIHDADKVVETKGRSTIIITHVGTSPHVQKKQTNRIRTVNGTIGVEV